MKTKSYLGLYWSVVNLRQEKIDCELIFCFTYGYQNFGTRQKSKRYLLQYSEIFNARGLKKIQLLYHSSKFSVLMMILYNFKLFVIYLPWFILNENFFNSWQSHLPASVLLDISNGWKEFLVRWLKKYCFENCHCSFGSGKNCMSKWYAMFYYHGKTTNKG